MPDVGPTRASRKGVGLVALALALVVGGALAGWALLNRQTEPPTHTITGDVSLTAGNYRFSDDRCSASSGYEDVAPGAAVRVTDDKGDLIGTGHLGRGTVSDGACVLGFTVDKVKDAASYLIQIPHEGLSISRRAMEASNYTVHATLG
jgi:hypothetical protein